MFIDGQVIDDGLIALLLFLLVQFGRVRCFIRETIEHLDQGRMAAVDQVLEVLQTRRLVLYQNQQHVQTQSRESLILTLRVN